MSFVPAFLYIDKMKIERPGGKTVNSMGAIIDNDPNVIASDVPCRLEEVEVEREITAQGSRQENRFIVFCNPDVDVDLNDFIEITREDGTVISRQRAKYISRPAVFKINHTEIELEPIGAR